MIKGANHFAFSEDGALLKSGIVRGILRLVGVLGLDGRRQVEVSAYAVRSFFDAWIRDGDPATVALTSPSYPEIVLRQ